VTTRPTAQTKPAPAPTASAVARPQTGGHAAIGGATPQDFEAIERALAKMLESDADVGNLTEGIGEPTTGDGWGGLDNLELEDLFPAKQRHK